MVYQHSGIQKQKWVFVWPIGSDLLLLRGEHDANGRSGLLLTLTCSAFGGLIAFGVQHAHVAIANWRLLFLVEGTPTIALGFLAMWLLPNRPEETSFLTDSERKLQMDRMNRGLKADVGRTVNKSHVTAAFKDWRVSSTLLMIAERELTLVADIHGRCHVLRRKLRTGIDISVPSHYHQNFRV